MQNSNNTPKKTLYFYDKKPIITPPAENFGTVRTLIGLFLRVLIIITAVSSLAAVFSRSFALDVNVSVIIKAAIISVVIFTLMTYSKKIFIGFGVIGIILFIITALKTTNIGLKCYSALLTTFNKILDKLIDIGYYGLLEKKVRIPLYVSDGIEKVFVVFVVVLAAIFTFACIKRTYIAAPAFISTIILVPLFMYNIITTNIEIALIICSFTAIITMRIFDKKYIDNIQSEEYDTEICVNENYGADIAQKAKIRIFKKLPQSSSGITGFCIFLISFLILLVPCLNTHNQFKTIPVISDKIEVAREVITAYLMGNEDLLDELIYALKYDNFEPRDLDLLERTFTGEEILTVESQSDIPLYLRGWVATDYDDGKWFTAEYEDATYNYYRAMFGENSDPAQTMFANFCNLIDSDILGQDLNYDTKGTVKDQYGFLIMQVNIEKLSNKTNSIIYLPTYANPLYPIHKYGSNNATDLTYTNFFDGIYSGKNFVKGTKYGVVTCTLDYNATDSFEGIVSYITYYSGIVNYIEPQLDSYVERCKKLQSVGLYDENGDFTNDVTLQTIKNNIFTLLWNYEVKVPGSIYNVQFSDIMSAAELYDFVDSICNSYLYTEYVYDTYTQKADSKIINQYYLDIVNNATETVDYTHTVGTQTVTEQVTKPVYFTDANKQYATSETAYINRNKLVTEIINNITNEDVFQYVLLPTKKPDSTLDPIENFLTVTHEGYCMQFASAAVLLLREAGIPARYVEGYVALNFKPNIASDAEGTYITIVTDINAHAWIEVWYDGIGWVQYEATQISYNSSGNNPGSTTKTPSTTYIPGTTVIIDTTIVPNTSYIPTTDQNTTDIPDTDTTVQNTTTYDPNHDTSTPPPTTDDTTDATTPPDSTISFDPAESITAPDTTNTPLIDRELMGKIISVVIITICSVGALSGTIVFTVISHKKNVIAIQARVKLVEAINSGEYNIEEQRNLAVKIARNVTTLLKVYGSTPYVGELSSEYAMRINQSYPEIFNDNMRAADMISHIAAEEFGNCMDNDGMKLLANVYTLLLNSKKRYLNPFERFYYRNIKHLI